MDLTPGPNEDQKRNDEQAEGFVWAVVFSNYEPAEVHHLFATRALADECAERLGDGWYAQRWAIQGWGPSAAYRAGREDAARDIEAPDSPLCDCPRLENPPVNPISKAGMDHHCDCRAVVTAAAMLGGFEATKHVAQCICGRTWRTGSLPPVNQPRTLHQGETQTPTAGGEQ